MHSQGRVRLLAAQMCARPDVLGSCIESVGLSLLSEQLQAG